MNIPSLKGKVALVCASSKGIGKEIALDLYKNGADVVITARQEDELKCVIEQAGAQKSNSISYFVADTTVSQEITKLVNHVSERFGKIDLFVFNTGTPKYGSLFDLSLEDMDVGYSQLLRAYVQFVKEMSMIMRKHKFGRIIALTAVGVKEPINHLALSNIFRVGVTSASKSFSKILGEDNITVNTVALGYFQTEALENLLRTKAVKEDKKYADVIDDIEKTLPIGRVPKVDEIAPLITFLCSEEASAISGVSISVDGGMSDGLFG